MLEIIAKLNEIHHNLILGTADGTKLCETIKANSGINYFPILILAYNEDIFHIAENCIADGFIKKPFVVDDLKSKIKNMS